MNRPPKASRKSNAIREQDEYEEDLADSWNTLTEHVEDDIELEDEYDEDIASSAKPVTQDLGDHRPGEDATFDCPFEQVDQLLRKWTTAIL